MKRLYCVMLMVGILTAPESVEAQNEPQGGQEPLPQKADWSPQPLRTLCATPAQMLCLSVLTMEFSQSLTLEIPGGGMRGAQWWFTTFEPFGDGFFASPVRVTAWLTPAYLYGGDHLYGGARVSDPGIYSTSESSPGSNVSRPPTAFDVGYTFSGSDFFARCGPVRGGTSPACYEVPEPSMYWLMLTGVLGLGLVAWRRKRETPV